MDLIETNTVILGAYLDDLPITTRVNVSGVKYLRKPNGRWTDTNPGNPTNYTPRDFAPDSTPVVVEFIPYPVPNPAREIPDAVLASWRSQFVNAVRYGARDHGVGNSLVNQAFTDIGLGTTDSEVVWQPGMSGRRGAVYALRDLPDESLVYSQRKVWRKHGSHFYQMAPKVDSSAKNLGDYDWSILRVGPDGDLAQVEVRLTTEERLTERQLRARAWQVGMRLKSEHGWCSALESIMQAGGLSPTDGQAPGLARSEVRSLPEGTLLFWQSPRDPSHWAVVRRDNSVTGTSRTRFRFGTLAVDSRRTMTPVWVPGRPWEGVPSWDVPNLREAAEVFLNLPVGTVVTLHHGFYRVLTEHRFGRLNARAGARLFASADRAEIHGVYTTDNWNATPGTVSIPYLSEENR